MRLIQKDDSVVYHPLSASLIRFATSTSRASTGSGVQGGGHDGLLALSDMLKKSIDKPLSTFASHAVSSMPVLLCHANNSEWVSTDGPMPPDIAGPTSNSQRTR